MSEDVQDMSGDVLRDGRQDVSGRRHLRMSVPQAAERLGITQDAVRKRVKRGYIGWEKDDDGRLYVWVDPTETQKETSRDTSADTSATTSIETSSGGGEDVLLDYVHTLKEWIQHLEEESRRKDHLLAAALERIPAALEAPEETAPEASSGSVTPSEKPGNGAVPREDERRSWLRKFFGL